MNAGGRLWARYQLRRRWRSILVLALLTAVAGGVAMAAITGARRSQVVVEEAMRERRAPDVLSLPSRPDFDWRPVVELPYVESYGLFAVSAMCIREGGGLDTPGALCGQPPVAGDWYESIAVFDLLAGRRPSEPDEIAINRRAQHEYGFELGDVLHLDTIGAGRLDQYWSGAHASVRAWGPTFEVTVTGVFEGSDDAWRLISGGVGHPGIAMSPSFIPAHGDQLDYRTDAFIRLTGGEADVQRLREDIARVTGDDTIPVRNVHEAKRRVQRSTSLEAGALWMFAAALGAVATVLLGQALARLVRAGAGDVPALRALGMAPRVLVPTLAAPGLAVAALGAAGAVAVAAVVSPRFPIGMARTFDRHPGVKFDVPVLVTGVLVLMALVAAVALAASVAAVRRARVASGRRTRVDAIRRFRLPVTVELGARMALERRPGGDAVPVRPAIVGATVGVLAVVAAFTFRAGLDETMSRPARGGQAWDVVLLSGLDEDVITSERDVVAAAEVARAQINLGGVPVPAYATRDVTRSPLNLVVLDGRLPAAEDEIAIGPATAAALDVDVDDEAVAGPGGDQTVRVVGTAFVPEVGGHSAYDEGLWITEHGLERLRPPVVDWVLYLVDVRDGVDTDAVAGRLSAAGAVVDDTALVAPVGLENLKRARDLPLVLGVILAVLGAGTVAHTLMTALRRRRRDLAALRALGMSRRALRAMVAWQATTLALVGVALGVPLGVLAGRVVWEWVATSMPLVHVAPVAVLVPALVVPATLAIVNALAWGPARAAATARPAAVLRAE